MVASQQREIPFFVGNGWHRGRGFCALAQVIGRTAFPLSRNYFVPIAKRVGADLLDFTAPEIAGVFIGRQNFKSAAKSVEETNSEKTVEFLKKERNCEQSHSNKICKTNQSVAKRRFFKLFSLIMTSNFLYQPFAAVSGNLGGKVPVVDDVLSSHQQGIYPTT